MKYTLEGITPSRSGVTVHVTVREQAWTRFLSVTVPFALLPEEHVMNGFATMALDRMNATREEDVPLDLWGSTTPDSPAAREES
jgi:hypothetical protein